MRQMPRISVVNGRFAQTIAAWWIHEFIGRPECRTPRPEPVCRCGYYLIEWE